MLPCVFPHYEFSLHAGLRAIYWHPLLYHSVETNWLLVSALQ